MTYEDNPFASYAATTEPTRRVPPPRLTGKIATRAEARNIYQQIVAELHACEDPVTLDLYLMTIGEELIQFEGELDFLWAGDGDDFAGLQNEIAEAVKRTGSDFRLERAGNPGRA